MTSANVFIYSFPGVFVMMRASLMTVFLTAATSAAQAAPAPPDAPKLIRLAPQSTAKQVGAFHYRLLPDPLDRTPGNAAPLWRLAGDAFREAENKRRMTIPEFDWSGQTPLKDLPRKEVRELLGRYGAALRLARQAACREHCDWEMPPLTLQSVQEFLPLETLNRSRSLAALLGIQYRLQLVEGRFEEAAETLQTGFALAYHLCESDLMLQDLVGIAIASIMVGRVEEWLQTPGSPNLYWTLTALPRPLGKVRRSIEHELNTFPRSFPRLRRLRKETLSEQQADDLLQEVFGGLCKVVEDVPKPLQWLRNLSAAKLTAEMYPAARKHLLDGGCTAKEIDKLPKAQVVLLHCIHEYDQERDDVLKALALPPWQGSPLMDQMMQKYRAAGKSGDTIFNTILALLMPAIVKTHEASVRLERYIAGLRGAEALRLYAATHKGKVPAKWSDITAIPLPVDPATGKGFDEFYQVKDGRAILEVAAPPGQPVVVGRRYELVPPVEQKKDR
jgi:hypothetical protein